MLKSVVYNYLDIYKCTYVLQKYTLLYKSNLMAYITYTYSKWCQIMSLTLYQYEESYAYLCAHTLGLVCIIYIWLLFKIIITRMNQKILRLHITKYNFKRERKLYSLE